MRLSGPRSLEVLQAVVQRPGRAPTWSSHRLYLGHVRLAGAFHDEVLAVRMAAPRSYTGEDVAEIHCHGGRILPALVVRACVERGARLARPGEFTLRAFLAGRLDLAQAEGVLALIQAGSEGAARLAAEGVAGVLSRRVRSLRQGLLDWLASWEAELDFGDEVSGVPEDEAQARLEDAVGEVRGLLEGGQEGRLLSEGILTVLFGPPNAGKSTLWNSLLREDRALVTPFPGTTRDQLEQSVVLGGHHLRLVDTAGLRPHGDPVEVLGMERTRSAASHAELLVVVLDSSSAFPEGLEAVEAAAAVRPSLVLVNKTDLPRVLPAEVVASRFPASPVVETTLLEATGVERARRAVVDAAGVAAGGRMAGALPVNQRQWQALVRCGEHLESLSQGLSAGMPADCLALDLRMAVAALGEVTGEDVTEEVLERIFSTFCLGK